MSGRLPTGPGDVFCYYDFQFENYDIEDKLFVILNDFNHDGSFICLSLITTSQSRHFPGAVPNCNEGLNVFLVNADQECFNEDTFIKLPKLYPFTIENLESLEENSMIARIGNISPQCHIDLLICLKKFKRFIAPEHWKILFPK